jgi:hypothetical protein
MDSVLNDFGTDLLARIEKSNAEHCQGCLALINDEPKAVLFCVLGGNCKELDREVVLGNTRETPVTSPRVRRAS